MKSIKINEYDKNMGILINIDDPKYNLFNAINYDYETLLYNKDKLLDKNSRYFIYCKGGYKSRMATTLLEAYGYNVTQVLINDLK